MKKGFCKYLLVTCFYGCCACSIAQSYVPELNNAKIKVQPAGMVKAYAFNLKEVRITDGIFLKAMKLDAAYLLTLKPDRFLYRFRFNAGLAPKDSIYGGWESLGVSGHTLGHYLSACAMMYASSGDTEFIRRVNYIVDELALCQQKRTTGYVGAIPNEDSIFKEVSRGNIHSAGFDLNGGWVPWYTIHKVLAGLADAYLYCDNKKALEILIKFAWWIDATTAGLNDDQWQTMLAAEHGGMNEVLANLYSFTGNKVFLLLSQKFYHKNILDVLANEKDELAGKHANTQIPKVLGVARLYELTGVKKDKTIADFFWNTVVRQHSYVIGGNSDYEHFTSPGKVSDHLSTNTTETCNTYNMLKLTRHLFSWKPSAAYIDYYERALYNHILASQNSNNGMMCYYVPLKAGTVKQYNTAFESFWCCTGSGMENHVKYAEQIYAQGDDGSLYVNLFIPSTLQWKDKQVTIQQQTSYPAGDLSTLIIHTKINRALTLHIRKPSWAGTFTIKINERPQNSTAGKNGFITISRVWKEGDKIEVKLPLSVYTEAMPDNPARLAFLYGPLVLAGKLSARSAGAPDDIPVLVTEKNWLPKSVQKQDSNLVFKVSQTAKPGYVTMVPFYAINNERQIVYFDVYDTSQWQRYKMIIEEEKTLAAAIDKRTIDVLRIGEMQPERDHNLQGEKTSSGEMDEHTWRDAKDGGWFSFNLQLADTLQEYTLQCTYWGSDGGGRAFHILIDGEKIATETLTASKPGKFISAEYKIPTSLTQNKQLITVTFQALPGNTAGGLFGCKLLTASN